MANLTAARDADRQEGVLVDVLHNNNKIYAGSIVTVDAKGYAEAGAEGESVLGVAMEDTPDDRAEIRIYAEGVFEFDGTGFTQADVGKLVVVADDHSVALADEDATSEQIVGKIINVISTTAVRVKL